MVIGIQEEFRFFPLYFFFFSWESVGETNDASFSSLYDSANINTNVWR